jgi:alkylhydroperoxidase family enzyme
VARSILETPGEVELDAAGEALSRLSRVLSDEPWRFGAAELAACRAAGMPEQSILHAIMQSAFFNYLNRVADATGIAFDYATPLPAMPVERERPPFARPPRAEWPRPAAVFALADRPVTAERFAAWRRYLLERDQPLSRRERRIVAGTAALATCDEVGAAELAIEPSNPREVALAAYADRLSRAPWQLGERELVPLRAHGLDDRALLDVISVASSQNTASRLTLAGVATAA